VECYGLSLRIPAYNGISHYFIALCGHKQFYVMLGTLVIIFDFIPGGAPFLQALSVNLFSDSDIMVPNGRHYKPRLKSAFKTS